MPRLDPSTSGTLLIDSADPANIYIGNAAAGASPASAIWRIRKVISAGTDTAVYYANGSPEYNQIWNNRTSLTYI